MSREIADALVKLADDELERIESILPRDPMQRTAIFMEICRITDARAVNPPAEDGTGMNSIDNSLIAWGWNAAAALLLVPLSADSPFPFAESTPERRAFVTNLLLRLGSQALIRRGAEMLRAGFVRPIPTESGWRLCSIDAAITMALHDTIDVTRLAEVRGVDPSSWEGPWHREDVDELMIPLMRPYPTPFGTMLAYDAIPEVDAHFLGRALVLANEWFEEAGLHPDTRLGMVTGFELLTFAHYFASFHIKHAYFVGLAVSNLPEVSPIMSITIWKPRAEMVADLAEYMKISEARVAEILDEIAFRADEAGGFLNETTPLHPLLIDLGNGYDLWPVSGIARNPFETIRRIHESRDPTAVERLAAPREKWFRDNLYALFDDDRFECVDGNVKIQIDGRIITDVDAAIYDRETDQLALFQIKWQDFSTNSPKRLGSKARNFMAAMNAWAETVTGWLDATDIARVMQSMRLKPGAGDATTVHLFGVSRVMARLGGMAKVQPHPRLALANWPQFSRIRQDPRSSGFDFATIHRLLGAEHGAGPPLTPVPMIIEIGGHSVEFADMILLVGAEQVEGEIQAKG